MAPHTPPGRQQRPAHSIPPQMRQYPPQRPAPRSSPMRFVGIAVLVLACLLVAAVSFVFIAAPVDLVRDRMVEEVRARTGRDLVVSGPVSMALFPSPGVTISGVTLSDGPGQPGTLLSVERISAQVSLGELLSRRVHVRRVVLSAPVLALRVDARGRRNWDFAAAVDGPATGRVRYAQARGPVMRDAPASGPAAGPAAFDPAAIREALAQALPGEVRIERGILSYRDQRTGDHLDVSGIDLEAGAQGLDAPVEAKGTFTLRGQPLAYTARISSLDAALASGRADLVVKAEGAPLSADFAGKLALPAGGPQIDGNLTLKSASIPALGLWLGRPVAMDGPADLSYTGRVQFARGQLSLPGFDSVIAGRPAKGSLAIDFNPRRPKITGQLQVASLDLGALLLRHPSDTPPAASGSAPKSDPIGDILRQQQRTPQVRGFTQRKGGARDWSDERLDVRLLALVDVDVRVAAGQVLHHDLKTGPGRVAINLTDRNLRVDLEDIALYGGRGRGVATVDAAAATPAMSLNLTLDGVSAGPLLKDAADFEWLDGRTSVAVVLAGQGFSERELVETLSGTVELKTVNGHLSGLNLPKLIRSLEMGQIPNVQIQPSEKTPFSELAGTYVIQKGIAQNNDLRLVTTNARITGTGVVQLPARTLAYDVRAKVSGTGTSPQQGAVIGFSNIEIPLRIEGPWEKPAIGLKGQEQIVEGIKQIGKNLKNPEVQDALRGLLGGGGDKSVKPADLLNRLLKKE